MARMQWIAEDGSRKFVSIGGRKPSSPGRMAEYEKYVASLKTPASSPKATETKNKLAGKAKAANRVTSGRVKKVVHGDVSKRDDDMVLMYASFLSTGKTHVSFKFPAHELSSKHQSLCYLY
ncbi:hypothetical protein N7495_003455 [Penicillium taxi]|uniref:uncharacterized protein n=1 Tax=Penicillium taxi TaxID=168475 RepID=UPI002544D72C|nr:uncharacterized protein N7495_003455 [Penicillium taxi]KAJ5902927.1 hypothetical protein N7495_003455 [Penicillium taxi]